MKEKIKRLNHKMFPGHYLFGPEWLVLGVNNVCNLHCKMCDVGIGDGATNFSTNLIGTRPLNMPDELIDKVMQDAAKYYPDVKIGFAFTEPLVFPGLISALKKADSLALYTSITTNALTLRQKAEELVDAGLNDLCISLDGLQDTHNKIRGNEKSFQKAVEGIEALLKLDNAPDISVFCVITEWNIGELKAFCDYFSRFPLKQIGFMHLNFTHQEVADKHNERFGELYPATHSNVAEINIDAMDLLKMNEEIQEIKTASYNFPIVFSPELNSLKDIEVFYHRPEVMIGKSCNDVYRNIMIKSDGNVIPAHGRCYNLQLGNIYHESLKDVWHSKVLSRFRKDLNKAGGLMPACSRCCSAF